MPMSRPGANNYKLISEADADDDAAVDVLIPAGYKELELRLTGVRHASDQKTLWMRTSSNGGSSFDSTGTHYAYNVIYANGNPVAGNTSAAAQILLTKIANTNVGNGAYENWDGVIKLVNIADGYPTIWYNGNYDNDYLTSGILVYGHGVRRTSTDVDAVRFLFEAGNITAGNFRLYALGTK